MENVGGDVGEAVGGQVNGAYVSEAVKCTWRKKVAAKKHEH